MSRSPEATLPGGDGRRRGCGSEPIRTLLVGLGPIGCGVAGQLLARRSLELSAVVDVDRPKVGRELAELLGREPATGLVVEGDLARAVERTEPALAIVCTGSTLRAVEPVLTPLLAAGVNVVSPCEELVLPELADAGLAAALDRAAREGGATALGIGVNPGFVLDQLPAVLAAACEGVERVRALRIVDAATRRRPLQEKVGAGRTREEFERLVETGELGHVGMRQSVALVGRALGLELDEIRCRVEAVIADRTVRAGRLQVARGRVAGLRDRGLGSAGGVPKVELELQMWVGAPDPHDEILIEGSFPSAGVSELRLRIPGGVPGDPATAALLINRGPQVVAARPGLVTVLDLPPPGWVP